MGLTFWSDRLFEIDEMGDGLYHCALPLTDIEHLANETMITDAFSGINKMYGGGDGPEDVLLGNYQIFNLQIINFQTLQKQFRYCIFKN